MEKEKESLWLSNNLMGETYEGVKETLSQYGEFTITDDDEWTDDGTTDAYRHTCFEVKCKRKSDGIMSVVVDFHNGEVDDVDVWFNEIENMETKKKHKITITLNVEDDYLADSLFDIAAMIDDSEEGDDLTKVELENGTSIEIKEWKEYSKRCWE